MRLFVWITVAFNLAACQSTTVGGCPPLINYSAAQQKQAAKELRTIVGETQLKRMIVDYGKMRDACRL